MEGPKREGISAAIIAVAQSFFPVLNLTGITHLTADGISVLMLFIGNLVTLGGLIYALRRKTI